MGRKRSPGLTLRENIWHIDKVVGGQRIRTSTGTSSLEEAERHLTHLLEELRQQQVYGVRRIRTFREAATRFLQEHADQPSIHLSATYLEQADPFLGDLPLSHIDDETLKPFVDWMKNGGTMPNGTVKRPSANRTINIALERIIRVLHLCHKKWRDEQKRPWLDVVPSITKANETATGRQPYPLSWDEQRVLFAELPAHLHRMALFKVNTGCREQEVCKLRWDWEIHVPELLTSVFLIPPNFGGRTDQSGVKNREDRLVILNDVARSIVESQRGIDSEWVFPFNGGPLNRMNDSAWRKARKRAAAAWKDLHGNPHPGFATVRVHDLKHTFGRRLRAAGASLEDRQALLGHKSGSVTTHYSSAELSHLIEVANSIANTGAKRGPILTLLRRKTA